MGSKPGWHYITQFIIKAIGGLFLLNSEIEETLRRFCRDKDLKKSSSRGSQVSDSQKTSEKSLEVSPCVAALKHFSNIAKIPRGLSLKSRKALYSYTKAVKCKEVRAEERTK